MELRDPAQLSAHIAETQRRFPGPIYYQVLAAIHAHLQPSNYVEIGVDQGISLAQALPQTLCIGIDPEPKIDRDLPKAQIHPLTSDEFFARYDLSELLGGSVVLAFIDGLHLFEQVLTDFINLEAHSTPNTVVLLHDCIPLDEATASRERTTDFYSGDVWKATMALKRRRPELDMVMVPTLPTGLCMVRRLDPTSRALERELPGIIAEYRDLGFDHYLAHLDDMPDLVPNTEGGVQAWLDRSPASR
jgi:predicted O-methyltransferase YrrM